MASNNEDRPSLHQGWIQTNPKISDDNGCWFFRNNNKLIKKHQFLFNMMMMIIIIITIISIHTVSFHSVLGVASRRCRLDIHGNPFFRRKKFSEKNPQKMHIFPLEIRS